MWKVTCADQVDVGASQGMHSHPDDVELVFLNKPLQELDEHSPHTVSAAREDLRRGRTSRARQIHNVRYCLALHMPPVGGTCCMMGERVCCHACGDVVMIRRFPRSAASKPLVAHETMDCPKTYSAARYGEAGRDAL